MRKLEDIGKWNWKVTIVGKAPAPAINEPKEVAESFDLFNQRIDDIFESLRNAEGKWTFDGKATDSCFMAVNALWNTRASLCTIPSTMSGPELERLAENIISLADLSLRLGAFIDWSHHKDFRAAPRRKGGKNSGIKRAENAITWQNDAIKWANEIHKRHDGRPVTAIAGQVEKKFSGPMPVKRSRLYRFLCISRQEDGSFKKVCT